MTRGALLLCSIFLTGCVEQSLALAAGERLRPTPPTAIELIEGAPSRPHEAIGTVHAHCRTHWLAAAFNCHEGRLREALRVRAGELGADAVVSIQRSSFWQIEWTDVHVRGRAVRWTAPSAQP
jgi:hypothetical protein